MTRRERRAGVYLHGERVGRLVEREDGVCVFAYEAAWVARPDAAPISLAMPVRTEPFESRGLHAFFLGLLPEGWNHAMAVRSLGIDPGDDMALLIATAVDGIGAVDVRAEDEAP